MQAVQVVVQKVFRNKWKLTLFVTPVAVLFVSGFTYAWITTRFHNDIKLAWVGLHFARAQVIKYVLATPPEQVAAASTQERARVNTLLDQILPVSARAAGLRVDSVLGKSLGPASLNLVPAPMLVMSARDDRFRTYASAEYTASQIRGAKFVGFEHGRHIWVGHNNEVKAEIVKLVLPLGTP
jgi:2-hydroxy-6-oxonona-2,4-dienedioate hydrolase